MRGVRQPWRERFDEKVDKTSSSKGCWLWTSAVNGTGYGQLRVDGKTLSAHRLAYERYNGDIPRSMVIDHMCHVRHCVNPDHLRAVTIQQNNENLVGPQKRNKSGIRGVTAFRDTGRWVAIVRHLGIQYHLGIFDTIEEAAEVARLKRVELFTHNDKDRN